ncbi:hypothetical protein QOT17_018277 [Balamuthia mandrillaris]
MQATLVGWCSRPFSRGTGVAARQSLFQQTRRHRHRHTLDYDPVPAALQDQPLPRVTTGLLGGSLLFFFLFVDPFSWENTKERVNRAPAAFLRLLSGDRPARYDIARLKIDQPSAASPFRSSSTSDE